MARSLRALALAADVASGSLRACSQAGDPLGVGSISLLTNFERGTVSLTLNGPTTAISGSTWTYSLNVFSQGVAFNAIASNPANFNWTLSGGHIQTPIFNNLGSSCQITIYTTGTFTVTCSPNQALLEWDPTFPTATRSVTIEADAGGKD
jgi:uncharacterized membrane protein YeiH